MNKFLRTVSLFAPVLLASCGGVEGEAQEAVRSLLKDPDSAQFANIEVKKVGEQTVVCGEVSAKNGFGGYNSPDPFYFVEGDEVGIATPGDTTYLTWQRYCQKGGEEAYARANSAAEAAFSGSDPEGLGIAVGTEEVTAESSGATAEDAPEASAATASAQ